MLYNYHHGISRLTKSNLRTVIFQTIFYSSMAWKFFIAKAKTLNSRRPSNFPKMMLFCNKPTSYRLVKLFHWLICFDSSELVKKTKIQKIKTACFSPGFVVHRSYRFLLLLKQSNVV